MTDSGNPALLDDLDVVSDVLHGGRHRIHDMVSAAEGISPAIPSGLPLAGYGETACDSLDSIALEIARCSKCRLAGSRKRVVPGSGSRSPLLLVVGEAPGSEEDDQGEPFVGAAGKLLDRMLAAIGLSRETNCFITNIVKCRPPLNRDPAPDEQNACAPYIRRQILKLAPRFILSAGRIPSQLLLDAKEGITKLRGRFFDFNGIPLIPTYHPNALLQDETLKRPAWEDLKTLKARIDHE